MCGILGVAVTGSKHVDGKQLRRLITAQFKLAESRGKEAAGFAIRTLDRFGLFKQPWSATQLVKSPEYAALLDEFAGSTIASPFALIGHSRLVTNGEQSNHNNNQPVGSGKIVGIHNGIICNDRELWRDNPQLQRTSDVDTEVLLALIQSYCDSGRTLERAVADAFGEIEGSASIALLFEDRLELLLATNTGSIYLLNDREDGDLTCFASEQSILEDLSQSAKMSAPSIRQLSAGTAVVVELTTGKRRPFSLTGEIPDEVPRASCTSIAAVDWSLENQVDPTDLKRCSHCILPETFPFIEYDATGVCNYCRAYVKSTTLGLDRLREVVEPYRRTDGRPDCIVAYSGGRDSCYGLHVFKSVLKMNPLTFTYDWGLVTDLARRNQARMCGKLGVEHIVVSADIKRKRQNVRKNVEAWLRRPELGMIPLFMAGDKQFFHYANHLRRRCDVPLVVFSVNPLEKTGFKTGFCGVSDVQGGMYFKFGLLKKLKLSAYYLQQYLRNPAYFNSSIWDTLWAFQSSFAAPKQYVMTFDYIPWIEEEVNRTLISEYNWELATDTTSTWRIGDGTAAFYNYIYYSIAGFTENDTFRSNQIREGHLSREQALLLVNRENAPRWDTLHWYARTIGFDLGEALRIVDAMPKLYDREMLQAQREIREHRRAA